jgi:hypothetical protein
MIRAFTAGVILVMAYGYAAYAGLEESATRAAASSTVRRIGA